MCELNNAFVVDKNKRIFIVFCFIVKPVNE